MQHRFRRLLQKNLLLVTLPIVLALTSLILVLGKVSRLEHFQTETMEDTSEAREFFLSGRRNVEVQLDGLTSTGFSYVVGDTEAGEYFYRIKNGVMEIVLLDKSTADELRSGKRESKSYLVRIIKDDATATYIEQQYADALGVPREELLGLGSVYLFDEIAYPMVRIVVLKISLYSLSVILVLLVAYVLLATAFPVLNFEARVLKKYGKVNRYIRKLDREIAKKLKMHQNNVMVTKNFLIVSYLTHIDVVRLDDVKYLSKHVERRKRKMGHRNAVYRLTASNGEDLYFEAVFFDEGVINDVIYYMRGEPLLEYEERAKQDEEESLLMEAMAEEQEREEQEEAERELYEQFDRDEFIR